MRQREFVAATGSTVRQIDYWTRAGMPLCEEQPFSGSGHYRNYKASAIPAVRLLHEIQNTFGTTVPVDMLMEVFHAYRRGHIDLGCFSLLWTVDYGTYGTSEGGA